MSVKFTETIQQAAGSQGIPLPRHKHELADEIGVALTGGKANVGQPGYLAVSPELLVTLAEC
jgi:hypothetical protein